MAGPGGQVLPRTHSTGMRRSNERGAAERVSRALPAEGQKRVEAAQGPQQTLQGNRREKGTSIGRCFVMRPFQDNSRTTRDTYNASAGHGHIFSVSIAKQ